MRSSSAVVILVSPNTLAHSLKLRLVVITTLVHSYSLGQQVEQQSSSSRTERQVAFVIDVLPAVSWAGG